MHLGGFKNRNIYGIKRFNALQMVQVEIQMIMIIRVLPTSKFTFSASFSLDTKKRERLNVLHTSTSDL